MTIVTGDPCPNYLSFQLARHRISCLSPLLTATRYTASLTGRGDLGRVCGMSSHVYHLLSTSNAVPPLMYRLKEFTIHYVLFYNVTLLMYIGI